MRSLSKCLKITVIFMLLIDINRLVAQNKPNPRYYCKTAEMAFKNKNQQESIPIFEAKEVDVVNIRALSSLELYGNHNHVATAEKTPIKTRKEIARLTARNPYDSLAFIRGYKLSFDPYDNSITILNDPLSPGVLFIYLDHEIGGNYMLSLELRTMGDLQLAVSNKVLRGTPDTHEFFLKGRGNHVRQLLVRAYNDGITPFAIYGLGPSDKWSLLSCSIFEI